MNEAYAVGIEYRIATVGDFQQLADLRWRLHVDDEPLCDADVYDRFVVEFMDVLKAEWKTNEIAHWIAVEGDHVLAVMSVVIVRKMPKPSNLRARWGYLCNSYVLPEVRNAGVGGRLLAVVKNWAAAENLELLVVWPSELAYPFYERAGFSRQVDPLVLKFAPPS